MANENIFDKHGCALADCEIKVYNYHPQTLEYIISSNEKIRKGVSIPGSSTLIAPPEDIPNKKQIFSPDNKNWVYVEDWRGTQLWIKSNSAAAPVIMNALGPIPDYLTPLKPKSGNYIWVNDGWVLDKDKIEKLRVAVNTNDKREALESIKSQHSDLKFLIDAGCATDEQKTLSDKLQKLFLLTFNIDPSAEDFKIPTLDDLNEGEKDEVNTQNN